MMAGSPHARAAGESGSTVRAGNPPTVLGHNPVRDWHAGDPASSGSVTDMPCAPQPASAQESSAAPTAASAEDEAAKAAEAKAAEEEGMQQVGEEIVVTARKR